jgi:RHS repeat-associated protein
MGVADSFGTIIEKLYYNSTGLCKSYSGSGVENVRPGTSLNIGRSQYIPFGWCGMYHDEYTGRYHTHYREYDPLHARWLTEDPAGYRDGLNLYAAYMGVDGIDPLGLGKLYDRFLEVQKSEKAVLKDISHNIKTTPWNPLNYGHLFFRGTWSLGKLAYHGIPGACDKARDETIDSDAPVPLKSTLISYTYLTEGWTESCFLFSMSAPVAPLVGSATSIPYVGPVVKTGLEGLVLFGAGYKTSEVGHKLFSDEFENDLDSWDFVECAGLWLGAGNVLQSYGTSQLAHARAYEHNAIENQGSAPMAGYTWNQVLQARYGAANVEWVSPKIPSKPLTLGILRTPAGEFELASGWGMDMV